MTISELSSAERHRVVAESFAEVTRQITDWDAPTPVAEWTARDVVGHLTEWLPAFLAGGGVELSEESVTPGGAVPVTPDAPAGDPVAAWARHAAGVQALLDGPDADRPFEHSHVPSQPLAATIDSFYTADVFMHTLDLARSNDIAVVLDSDYCERLLGGLASMEELLRGSGQYGPAFDPPAGADPQTRLAAFIGRDPDWKPSPQL